MTAVSLVDLHMHSTASDGTDGVPDILRRVKEAGLRAFSVTDEGKKLRLLRFVVLGVVVCACAYAIANPEAQVLILNYISMALRGGGIFLPLTLAVFCPGRVAPKWALISMILSTAVAVLFSTVLPAPVHPLFIGLAVSAALLLPGLLKREAKI